MWRPRRPPSHREVLLASALLALALAELATDPDFRSDGVALGLVAAGMAAALAWRVVAPVPALAALLAFGFAADRIAPAGADDPMILVVVLIVGIYSAGAHARGRAALAGAALTLLGAWGAAAQDPDVTVMGDYVFFLLIVGGPWLVGRAIALRRDRESTLEARAVTVERESAERARQAVAEERTRIARELHDVVAHAISVVVVQARGGRRSLASDPAEARDAFDQIELTGRDALAEMRRLLGMLRQSDEELALAPQPCLRNLDALVRQMRDAGLPVELSVEGEPAELPAGVDLSAFRIVQEALTNALRHAGPATARVQVRYGEGDVEVEVRDTGAGASSTVNGAGHGLVGMRERASLYGGEVEAGSHPEGGFAVRARLPTGAPAR